MSFGDRRPAYADKWEATCAKRRITKGRGKVSCATERQFLSGTEWSIPRRTIARATATIQFPSRYFYLTDDGGAVMDTQKPLTSVYRILAFADAIFIGTSYRRRIGATGRRRRADTRTPIYHHADFYCSSCIRSKFRRSSQLLFYRRLEAWRVITPLDVNL